MMTGFSFNQMTKTTGSDPERAFVKMHGLGNDFVIFDARTEALELESLLVKSLADRRTGIGFDICVVLRHSEQADVFMEFWNPDGGMVDACGNATRCVASIIMAETDKDDCTLQTNAGLLIAVRKGENIQVDMGQADNRWSKVPLYQATDTKSVDLDIPGLPPAVCLSVGNPHAIFFVDKVMTVPVEELGPQVEEHWMFPEKVNASFVEVRPDHLRVRVWERGVGITRACGTAACATLVAAARRELTGRSAKIILDGGPLQIKWLENGNVMMTGPVAHAYSGITTLAFDEGF